MSPEIPLQRDMFTGEWVDTRSRSQKQLDREAEQPKQILLFSTRETIVFGANPRPWLAETPKPTLELVRQDPRTPEEIEHDEQREAEEQTLTLFVSAAPESSEGEDDDRV